MKSFENKTGVRDWGATFFKQLSLCLLICQFLVIPGNAAFSQAQVEPWGNIMGMRVNGQLIPFESSLAVVEDKWRQINATAQEHQRPKYIRVGNKQIVTTKIDSINFVETIEDSKEGTADVNVAVSSNGVVKKDAVFFVLSLPLDAYISAGGSLNTVTPRKYFDIKLKAFNQDSTVIARAINFVAAKQKLTLLFNKPTEIIFKKSDNKTNKIIRVYFSLMDPGSQKDSVVQKTFTIKASGTIDNAPITFKLNTSKEGRAFDGFGGNFRLQNPKADPQVIDYCLQNIRVAWGRVEFPWSFWQSEENMDPVAAAKEGKLNLHVQQSLEMAARLGKMRIPIILSGWFPPQWAVVGKLNMNPVNGVWGNPLDSTKMDEIYKSITDYILYLKNNYNTDVALFSFNESDLGINVRVTPLQHDALIKGLGAYFKLHGLATKMLLSDNSDATTYQFIYPALHDAEAKPYIGAISFHSWRGCDNETLKKWKAAADELKVPLIVGEGSIDAAAWNYPAIFEEQIYIMQEIELYVRLLAVCQPLTILQWQFTSDYSPMAGGGIFGNDEPLRPTQRLWNFKQLASTPKGLFSMPVSCNRPGITVAAVGDNKKKVYTIHIVNKGAARNATLTGLPASVKNINIYTTDKNNSVKKGTSLKVINGTVKFYVNSESFTTLIKE
ncbi:hypothetical protein FW778_15475 [Ginsengibacter hankyongi]|uniref:O-Glycosyl hydrolase n=1 Tax=Ginsengibacter hankyongi TaxID=2607284 RepID=A0A5J5IHR9_9BACT|nr:hypothetical protein [Ginsengibacter hankyongi]KAA9038151.1 hypothetical protein FW778_15475 [Ginsengibacter hankyongi]